MSDFEKVLVEFDFFDFVCVEIDDFSTASVYLTKKVESDEFGYCLREFLVCELEIFFDFIEISAEHFAVCEASFV